jgi:hypothetical protein
MIHKSSTHASPALDPRLTARLDLIGETGD